MKAIVILLILPHVLLAGNIFKSSGDLEWLKETLGLKEIVGFEVMGSEESTVLGQKYWSYKIKATDPQSIFSNLNLKGVKKLKTEENLESARSVLPVSLRDSESIFHTRKKFRHYYSDILIVTLPKEAEDKIMHIVFCREHIVIKPY